MNAKLFSISLLAAGVLLASASQANASGYKFTDLDTLGGTTSSNPTFSRSSSGAAGINDSGQVVGYAMSVWNAEPGYGPTLSQAEAIIWNGTTPTSLGSVVGLNGRGQISATGINDSGQVVGSVGLYFDSHAITWNGATLTNLGTLGGSISGATGINNSGQVVGYSTLEDGYNYHATLWNGTTPTDLGTLGGNSSRATGINNSGQVVGYATLEDGYNYHATLWNGTTPTDLGTLGGNSSGANGINDSGQVVGYSTTLGHDYPHATLWNGTTPMDLNSFLSVSEVTEGWVLDNAYAINDNGWIAGNAHNSIIGLRHAFLLTPCDTCSINQVFEPPPIAPAVPEPETYAMFMAGLGLMGFIARRRKDG